MYLPPRSIYFSFFFGLLGMVFLLMATGCKDPQNGMLDENIRTLFSYDLDGINNTEIAEAFLYDDSIIIMTTGDLSFYFDGLELRKKNLSQSSFSEVIVSGTYSTNVKNATTGFIQIEKWDERNIQISGRFQFDAYDSFDTTNLVAVRNGRFEEISIFRTNRNFYKGKARAAFNNQNIAYRLVNTQYNDSTNSIIIRLSHPSKNDFTLTFDADILPGNYSIKDFSSNQFSLTFEDRLVKQTLLPSQNCTLSILKLDLDNEDITLNISGEFSDEFTAPFIIEDLDISTFTF